MKSHAVPTLLPLLSVLQICVAVSWACNPDEYWKEGLCCKMCSPGQKLVSECTDESTTQCEDCARGEFQDQWNKQRHCKPMSNCDLNAGFEQASPGTAEQDAVCACTEGLHCSSEQCETCVHDTACGPGFGVTRRANKVEDTRCESCPAEFFSNETSLTEPCRPWTSCKAQNQVVLVPGSAVSDVTCGQNSKVSSVMVGALVATVVVLALVILFAVLLRLRNKGQCMAKTMKNPDRTNQPEEEAEETAVFVPPGNPVQESYGEQEVGKESHLPEQEDSAC
ncbi:tumor necrosis factor receptor superfamily member 5 isoform X1 [Pleurodeles waltl]|uniref:tumor necrosis factor receptor superfamily member 5 isoform X1 n=1 Tax=Pleurodeles waltl TaxID=8319 RepID=UPI003709BCE5